MFPYGLPAILVYSIENSIGCSEVNRVSDKQGTCFDCGNRMPGIGSRVNQCRRSLDFPPDLECFAIECDQAVGLCPENNQLVRYQRG